MRIIDSHVHFWRIGGPGQTWPDAQWPLIYRDFGPADLLAAQSAASAALATHGPVLAATHGAAMANRGPALTISGLPLEMRGVVLVQSQPDDRDTDWLMELAAGTPLVAGVVGWVDLASASAPTRIAHLARDAKLRGLRPMLQSIDDTRWLLRPDLEPALRAMVQQGLRFDALIQPRHLPMLLEFARRWPDLPIVIDHGAKPRIIQGEIELWRSQMGELGRLPQVYCKLSGLRTEQASGAASSELDPYMRTLVDAFPDRLMWGSDWPVLLHSGDEYADWLKTSLQLGEQVQGTVEPHSLFYSAARRFYGLD